MPMPVVKDVTLKPFEFKEGEDVVACDSKLKKEFYECVAKCVVIDDEVVETVNEQIREYILEISAGNMECLQAYAKVFYEVESAPPRMAHTAFILAYAGMVDIAYLLPTPALERSLQAAVDMLVHDVYLTPLAEGITWQRQVQELIMEFFASIEAKQPESLADALIAYMSYYHDISRLIVKMDKKYNREDAAEQVFHVLINTLVASKSDSQDYTAFYVMKNYIDIIVRAKHNGHPNPVAMVFAVAVTRTLSYASLALHLVPLQLIMKHRTAVRKARETGVRWSLRAGLAAFAELQQTCEMTKLARAHRSARSMVEGMAAFRKSRVRSAALCMINDTTESVVKTGKTPKKPKKKKKPRARGRNERSIAAKEQQAQAMPVSTKVDACVQAGDGEIDRVQHELAMYLRTEWLRAELIAQGWDA